MLSSQLSKILIFRPPFPIYNQVTRKHVSSKSERRLLSETKITNNAGLRKTSL